MKVNVNSSRMIDHYEHKIIIEKHEYDRFFPPYKRYVFNPEIHNWCEEVIGNYCSPFNQVHSFACSSLRRKPYYIFTFKDDAILFKVTWS